MRAWVALFVAAAPQGGVFGKLLPPPRWRNCCQAVPGNACAASALGELGVEYFCGRNKNPVEYFQSQLLSVSSSTGGVGEAQGGSEWKVQLWEQAGEPLVEEVTAGLEAGTARSSRAAAHSSGVSEKAFPALH